MKILAALSLSLNTSSNPYLPLDQALKPLKAQAHGLQLRQPETADAAGIWRLVRESKVLDPNSCYAYLLLTTHFAESCVVADCDGHLAGFITAYFPPAKPGVLFVWQIAVAEEFRGQKLARQMLNHLLSRNFDRPPEYLETTITPSNIPSRRLFSSLASELGVDISESIGFVSAEFLFAANEASEHEDECLIRIGPLGRSYGDV